MKNFLKNILPKIKIGLLAFLLVWIFVVFQEFAKPSIKSLQCKIESQSSLSNNDRSTEISLDTEENDDYEGNRNYKKILISGFGTYIREDETDGIQVLTTHNEKINLKSKNMIQFDSNTSYFAKIKYKKNEKLNYLSIDGNIDLDGTSQMSGDCSKKKYEELTKEYIEAETKKHIIETVKFRVNTFIAKHNEAPSPTRKETKPCEIFHDFSNENNFEADEYSIDAKNYDDYTGNRDYNKILISGFGFFINEDKTNGIVVKTTHTDEMNLGLKDTLEFNSKIGYFTIVEYQKKRKINCLMIEGEIDLKGKAHLSEACSKSKYDGFVDQAIEERATEEILKTIKAQVKKFLAKFED